MMMARTWLGHGHFLTGAQASLNLHGNALFCSQSSAERARMHSVALAGALGGLLRMLTHPQRRMALFAPLPLSSLTSFLSPFLLFVRPPGAVGVSQHSGVSPLSECEPALDASDSNLADSVVTEMIAEATHTHRPLIFSAHNIESYLAARQHADAPSSSSSRKVRVCACVCLPVFLWFVCIPFRGSAT